MGQSTRELTQEEYEATLVRPMVNVTETAEDIGGLWEYLDPVIEERYHACQAWDWMVTQIFESPDGRFQHWYVPVPQDQTYLLAVVDKPSSSVLGHYILDLRAYAKWLAERPGNVA